jgi:hypothetical protein
MDIRRIRKLMIVLSLVVMVLVLEACCGPCCEEIAISSPAPGMSITSPVTVMGMATIPFEGQMEVRVWDSGGQQIGSEAGYVTGGEWGQCGSYTVSVPFTAPSIGDSGIIQVFTVHPMNGQLQHLSSVAVQLP